MNKRGFTLVEMLVVIAVLSIVGLLVLTIFTRTLRGSNKAQIVLTIKQNGLAVLETIDKTIRNSDSVVCISENPDNTIVVHKDEDNLYTRYRFVVDSTGVANGLILQDNPQKGASEVDGQFISRICAPLDSMSGAHILTDTNPLTGVSLISGSFTRSVGIKNLITIQFVLAPGANAPPAVAGQIDPITFQTTIERR